MKRYLGKIILCVLPVIASALIVWWACDTYVRGKGGFRLGVDLAGGTILVYEVDLSKMTDEARRNFKAEDLAAALKKRIDPADLHNATIRPVPGDPPRVEIILPTGGRQQSKVLQEAWDAEVKQVTEKYPPTEDVTYDDVPRGQINELIDRVMKTQPKDADGKPIEVKEVAAFIRGPETQGPGKRAFTGEEIEDIKNIIQKQGRLEFRILANEQDDKDAIGAAQAYLGDAANKAELDRRAVTGEPPPPPTQKDGEPTFTVNVGKEAIPHKYSWVGVGKQELYSMQLNSQAETEPLSAETQEKLQNKEQFRKLLWSPIEAARAAKKTSASFIYPDSHHPTLLYYREVPNPDRLLQDDRDKGKKVEWFVLTRESEPGKEITGDDLSSESEGMDEGKRAVHFSLKPEGAARFYELTTRNTSIQDANKNVVLGRQLAVILDNQVQSAPNLMSGISSQGQISGDFTQKEIEDLLRILRAGALPATLRPQPVSENTMGATLGEDTIFRGAMSVGLAFAAVLLFMLVYYRFAGVVACIALLANLLLTVAFMVLVSATFTLPGLAGLVLMLGMAVDANVLIYERLREERERGASLALAVRNGYDRAFPTIIDTHMTSIFTAIVLYVVGNDQLKGFGISLTVGLIISLFTSLVMTRTVFDIWLNQNWLHTLYFMQLFKRPNINFMRIRHVMFALTVGATILGAALFIYRLDKGGLNIDFVGGTAYAGRLTTPVLLTTLRDNLEPGKRPLSEDEMKQLNVAGDLPDLSIEQVFVSSSGFSTEGKSDLFTVRTSEKNPEIVQRIVNYKLEHAKLPGAGEPTDILKRIDMLDPVFLASQASLEFVQTAKKDEPGYVAPDEVKKVLEKDFKDLEGELKDAAKKLKDMGAEQTAADKMERARLDRDAKALDGLTFTLTPSGKEEDGKAAKMTLALTDKPLPLAVLKTALGRAQAELSKGGVELKAPDAVEAKASDAVLQFVRSTDKDEPDYASRAQVAMLLDAEFKAAKEIGARKFTLVPDSREQDGRFSRMIVKLSEQALPVQEFRAALTRAQDEFHSTPQPERLENFDSQLARDTQTSALYAILLSWIAILLYLWFRFGSWTFGAATVVCLIHDLFFTLGAIAACHFIHEWAPGLAYYLGLADFKIDLPAVAALLTLVGYSVSDTIVVFDRIREVRGKNPLLTYTMINDSVNQTLSRTILSSLTVFLVVGVLYLFGGEGVHLFAFVMVVGVVVGTYSSIYIASPLLIMFGEGVPTTERAKAAAAQAAAAAAARA